MTFCKNLKNFLIVSYLTTYSLPALAQPKIESIVNAASLQPGLPNGGALATVFVSGFNAPPVNAIPGLFIATSVPLPYQLGGVSISIYGRAYAPILSVSIPPPGSADYAQINFQVPLERNVPSNINDYRGTVIVAYNRGAYIMSDGALPLRGAAGFFADSNKFILAQHASDYSPVTKDHPARPGEAIVVYADDFFEVWPGSPIGLPAPTTIPLQAGGPFPDDQLPMLLYLQTYPSYTQPNPITHLGGGYFATTPPVKTTFVGLAPGQIGVEQVNFIVPSNQQPGTYSLFVADGFGSASPEIYLPVQ